MISGNAELHEQCKIVTGFTHLTPSSSTPDYVSLKGYNGCAIIIQALNVTTVTGSAITVKQATTVAAAGEKAVTFFRVCPCRTRASGVHSNMLLVRNPGVLANLFVGISSMRSISSAFSFFHSRLPFAPSRHPRREPGE